MKILLKYTSLIFLSILALSSKAQFSENIASGRPGNANGAFSVGKGVYQLQTGYNMINSTFDHASDLEGLVPKERTLSGSDAMFRIGIKEDVELRISGNFVFSDETSATDISRARTLSGLESLNIGFRHTMFQQNGILPSTAIQFSANFGGGGDYSKENPDATLRLNFANRITEKLNLNWNFSSRWSPDNSAIIGFYIFSFSYPFTEDLAITAETFGNIEETTTYNGGLGLAYLLNSEIQFDVYASYGEKEINRGQVVQQDLSLTAGISYRIVNR